MPAVTVSDITTLARIPEPAPDAVERGVRSVTDAPTGYEGEGFPVRRAFAGVATTELDPFIHMDQMGEVEYAPGEPKGTAWHPHRGFETVTYIIDGTFEHADSHGGGWHHHRRRHPVDDRRRRHPAHRAAAGGAGGQRWAVPRPAAVGQPAARVEDRAAALQDLRAGQAALLTTPDGGALLRVIAGEVAGQHGPVATYTPMAMVHATISPGAQLRLPWRPDFNALVYVLSGAGTIGAERRPVHTGQLAVFGPGDLLTVAGADHQESRYPALDVVVPGWHADQGARRLGWPVRDEHQGRGAAGRSRTSRPAGSARSRPSACRTATSGRCTERVVPHRWSAARSGLCRTELVQRGAA